MHKKDSNFPFVQKREWIRESMLMSTNMESTKICNGHEIIVKIVRVVMITKFQYVQTFPYGQIKQLLLYKLQVALLSSSSHEVPI